MKKVYFPQIDFAKFITVTLMLLTHVVAFLYVGSSPALAILRDWGNTVTFTVLLFISGAVAYIAYLQPEKDKVEVQGKLWRRLAWLYIGYLFLNGVMWIGSPGNWFLNCIGAAVLLTPAPYTEYFIPFLITSLLLIFVPGFLRTLARRPLAAVLLGLTFFSIGELAWRYLQLPGWFNNVGLVFFGGEETYRFPLLQYFSVFSLGLVFGKIWQDGKVNLKEYRRELALGLLAVLVVGVAFSLNGPGEVVRRWPPSIAFLTVGVIWCGALIGLGNISGQNSTSKVETGIFALVRNFFARNSLLILIVHTTLLALAKVIQLPVFTRGSLLALAFVISMILTIAVVFICRQALALFRDLHKRTFYSLLLAIIVGGILAVAGSSTLRVSPAVNPQMNPSTGATATRIVPADLDYWQDAASSNRIYWEIPDSCCKAPSSGQDVVLELNLDHAALVGKKLSLPTGSDLKLFVREATGYKQVDYSMKEVNTAAAKLAFKVPASLIFSSNEPLRLFLYTGDYAAINSKQQANYPARVDFAIDSKYLQEAVVPIALTKDKNWHLTGDSWRFNFGIPEILSESTKLEFEIFNSTQNLAADKAIAVLPLTWEPSYRYELTLDPQKIAGGLNPGTYRVRVRAALGANDSSALIPRASDYAALIQTDYSETKEVLYSPAQTIYYSAPLYTAWSIDWEGYDLQQKFMQDMEQLSQNYRMPMTHFFNPRIYVNKAISPARAQALTNWVKQRAQLGDEIALHLHMHLDLVEAAGVTPRTEPAWGGRTEGHDVITTAYDEAEFTKIVSWAQQQFRANGLPKPSGYRAGAWFMDSKTLRVLDQLDFMYDSSGSDYTQPYGPNRIPRSWRGLTPQSRPYQVSRTNQSSDSPKPLLDLWELPNNGADSTNRNAEELIKRLRLNLELLPNSDNPQTLQRAQVLVYLSHPHWFNIDKPKMLELFNAAEKYKYENDSGPIIYTTESGGLANYQRQLELASARE